MADLTLAASTYASSGSPDTASTLVGGTDEVQAEHQNYPNGAIIGIQTILGNALTLKGSVADLVARLAVLLEANGKMKNLSSANKTTFPGVVSEGMTGATSFTASQLIRKHASNDVLESSGLTVAAGTSGDVVTVTNAQTLTNKTLTTPTIASFTNATHAHTNADGGGTLTGAALTTSQIITTHLKTTARSTTSSAFTDNVGGTHTFTVTGSRVGDFAIDPSTANGGSCTLTQIHAAQTNAASTTWKLTVANDGIGAGTTTYTVTWSTLDTTL